MDNNTSLVRFFKSVKEGIADNLAIEIAGRFTPVTFKKGDYFLEAGKMSNQYLFLEEGFMRAFACDTENNEVTTNFYSGGQVVFEVASFFNRTRSREYIQALTDCKGQVLTFDELNNLFHSMPEFREMGRAILVKGFSALKERMLTMITEPAETRYLQLLQKNPEIVMQAPLKTIASYLGITDTSLSRIRKELMHK